MKVSLFLVSIATVSQVALAAPQLSVALEKREQQGSGGGIFGSLGRIATGLIGGSNEDDNGTDDTTLTTGPSQGQDTTDQPDPLTDQEAGAAIAELLPSLAISGDGTGLTVVVDGYLGLYDDLKAIGKELLTINPANPAQWNAIFAKIKALPMVNALTALTILRNPSPKAILKVLVKTKIEEIKDQKQVQIVSNLFTTAQTIATESGSFFKTLNVQQAAAQLAGEATIKVRDVVGKVLVTKKTGYGILSGVRSIAEEGTFGIPQPAEGAPQFIAALQKLESASVHYISDDNVLMYDIALKSLLEKFPIGTIKLERGAEILAGGSKKIEYIQGLLNMMDKKKFILVGDESEDLQTFVQIYGAFKTRVQCIYIRNTDAKVTSAQIAAKFPQFTGLKVFKAFSELQGAAAAIPSGKCF